MEIKNMTQLKAAIKSGREFIILTHYIKPEYTGQRRRPVVAQTNGFYSAPVEDIEAGKPLPNDGKGYWLKYGRASEWIFEKGTCKHMIMLNGVHCPIWTIQFCDD